MIPVPLKSVKSTIDKAKNAELGKDLSAAAELYEEAIKEDPLNEYAYDRLMIIYRKQKEYKKELKLINAAIKAYQQFYKSHQHTGSKKIAEISKKLNRSFGLTDKKGNNLYQPEPIAGWEKRKAVVQKRIK